MADSATLPDMRIGALTACGPRMSLEDWFKAAKQLGLDGLEVACFQAGNLGDVASGSRKDYVADTLNVDEPLTPEKIRGVISMSKDYGVAIHSLGSYDNQLHPISGIESRNHLKRVINTAANLREVMPAGPLVATFVGADPNLRIQENFEVFKNLFLPVLDYAKQKGVRVMIENCPMEGWEPSDRPVNNLMSSPRLWDACFAAANDAGVGEVFGLEYDPSHRLWQTAGRVDLVQKDLVVYGKRGKIFSLHGKGAHFNEEGLWRDGIDGRLIGLNGNEWAKRNTIYEHAVPGIEYDSVDWGSLISAARQLKVPFVSIEIEDPAYKDMNDIVRNGELGVQAIRIGRDNLKTFCYSNGQSYQSPKK